MAVAVTGGGSGTGISALINGTVDIANASREMKDKEIELARANGVEPVEFIVGYDALAVFVHRDNPIGLADPGPARRDLRRGRHGRELGAARGRRCPAAPGRRDRPRQPPEQLAAPTSTSRKPCSARRASTSSARATCTAPRTSSTWSRNTPCAIGYSGLAYATARGEDAARSPRTEGQPAVAPTVETAPSTAVYPIARPLFMYTRGAADGGRQGVPRLDPQRRRPVHHPRQGLRARAPDRLARRSARPPGRGDHVPLRGTPRARPPGDPRQLAGRCRRSSTPRIRQATQACSAAIDELASRTILGDHPINRATRELDRLCHASSPPPAERRRTCASSRRCCA